MALITARISDEMDGVLSHLAQETDRNKGYIVRKAIESYLEDKADLLIALSRIERQEKTISLDEIVKKYDL